MNHGGVVKKDYGKIEVMNKINVNVFCYGNKMVHPVYLSNQCFNDCLDLLLISNNFTSHYVYIKDFNRLMFNKTRHKGKKYFCKSCLQCFSSESVLSNHKKDCLMINNGQNVLKFIKRIFKEYDYCSGVMKKQFNKNLVMTAEENEEFERSNICWICGKLIDLDDNKVRDHCHIFGKYRGSNHCNINLNATLTLKLIKKFL